MVTKMAKDAIFELSCSNDVDYFKIKCETHPSRDVIFTTNGKTANLQNISLTSHAWEKFKFIVNS